MAIKLWLVGREGRDRPAEIVAEALAEVATLGVQAGAELAWLADDAVAEALRATDPELVVQLGTPQPADAEGWRRLLEDLTDHEGARRVWVVADSVGRKRRELLPAAGAAPPVRVAAAWRALAAIGEEGEPVLAVVDAPQAEGPEPTQRVGGLVPAEDEPATGLTAALCAGLAGGVGDLAALAAGAGDFLKDFEVVYGGAAHGAFLGEAAAALSGGPRLEPLAVWLGWLQRRYAVRREDAAAPRVELRRRLHGRPAEAGTLRPLAEWVAARRGGRLVVLTGDADEALLARALITRLATRLMPADEVRVPLPVDLPHVAAEGLDAFAEAERSLAASGAAARTEGLAEALRWLADEGRLVLVVTGYDGRPGLLPALVALEAQNPHATIVVLAPARGFQFLLHFDVATVETDAEVAVTPAELRAALGDADQSGEAAVSLAESLRHDAGAVAVLQGLAAPDLSLEQVARLHYVLSAIDRLGSEAAFFERVGRPRQPVEINTVSVPGGAYVMGSDRADFHAEAPAHPVTLGALGLSAAPLTRGAAAGLLGGDARDPAPLVGVSWYVARLVAHWLGGRLPTEAEWEHAARRAEGDRAGGAEWRPDPAVATWCLDWHGTYPPFHRRDPVGRWAGHARAVRGGGGTDPDRTRPAFRAYLEPWKHRPDLGLVVVWPRAAGATESEKPAGLEVFA